MISLFTEFSGLNGLSYRLHLRNRNFLRNMPQFIATPVITPCLWHFIEWFPYISVILLFLSLCSVTFCLSCDASMPLRLYIY